MPSSTAVGERLLIWSGLLLAPARLIWRPSTSPSQPSRSASKISQGKYLKLLSDAADSSAKEYAAALVAVRTPLSLADIKILRIEAG
jgi:hypothetical protein